MPHVSVDPVAVATDTDSDMDDSSLMGKLGSVDPSTVGSGKGSGEGSGSGSGSDKGKGFTAAEEALVDSFCC